MKHIQFHQRDEFTNDWDVSDGQKRIGTIRFGAGTNFMYNVSLDGFSDQKCLTIEDAFAYICRSLIHAKG